MARDFYVPFPHELPSLPAVRRLGRGEFGPRAKLAYYELRVYASLSYQYGRTLALEDALAYAPDWGMTEDEAAAAIGQMADLRLIDAGMLEEGLVGVPDIAERALYLQERSECGKRGGRPRKGKAPEESSEKSQEKS